MLEAYFSVSWPWPFLHLCTLAAPKSFETISLAGVGRLRQQSGCPISMVPLDAKGRQWLYLRGGYDGQDTRPALGRGADAEDSLFGDGLYIADLRSLVVLISRRGPS